MRRERSRKGEAPDLSRGRVLRRETTRVREGQCWLSGGREERHRERGFGQVRSSGFEERAV